MASRLATASPTGATRCLAPALFAALLALGCQHVEYRPEPFTTEQILQETRQQVPADDIIRRIRESRTVYPIRARDVKSLLEQGVDERVVDEMMQTPVREAEYYSWKYPYYPYSYYYYPYYYSHIGFYP